tara:strand:+ start:658 stop:1812 length:1155 start_codon:yes stop_codon:yes gene_type:complete
MIRSTLLMMSWIACVLAPGAVAQDGPTDADVTRAWQRMSADQKGEAIAWFQAEIDRRESFQNQLMRHVFFSLPHGRRRWPKQTPAPVFDAAKHCPAQPIARKKLEESSSALARERKTMMANIPERRIDSAWDYDWALGTVVQTGDPDDPDRIFANALKGAPPELDLAEAILTGMLDDGKQREVHAAFGHLYADRNGTAYPGITLYDAWCSGRDLEMPDVECLGIVHTLADDWKTWVAPVAERKQDSLYERLGEWFTPIQRQRALATALARTYFQGDPVLRDGYDQSIGRLHGIWEAHVSDPPRVLEGWPNTSKVKDWERWFTDQDKLLKRDKEMASRAAGRHATLLREAVEVRAVLIAVLKEMGALDPPKPAPVDDTTGSGGKH